MLVSDKKLTGASNGSHGFVVDGMLRKVGSPSYPAYPDIRLAKRTGESSLLGWGIETVARSLNNAVADAAVARAAEKLGHAEHAQRMSERARRASRALFNDSSKFFQPRGTRVESSSTALSRWPGAAASPRGAPTTTGTTCHTTWSCCRSSSVGSCAAPSGRTSSTRARPLSTTVATATTSTRCASTRRCRRISDFGMYNHCNQPSHEVLWVAKKAGCDELADKYLRRVMDKLYTTEGWCGDEDNGEMGAWYVLPRPSALGIYSLEGAKDELVLGSPAVAFASLRLPGDRGHLTVVAKNQ
ncbi:unnamed protein product, partial [Prorocentrum cordatum]